MRKRILIVIGLTVVVVGSSAMFGLYQWSSFRASGSSQTVERAEREHGVTLPASVSNIQCLGDAYLPLVPDKGASTAFEMSTADVSVLKSQLGTAISYQTFIPGNPQYQGHTFAWLQGAGPSEVVSCASSTGDWLHVEFWPIDEERVGVRMYTDWN